MKQQVLSIGVYEHYSMTKDNKFLKDNLKMLEKAVKFLEKYVKDILEEKRELKVSYDLWEMYEGVTIYSLASIFGAYDAMLKIYRVLEDDDTINKLKQESVKEQEEILQKGKRDIKKYIMDKLYDEEKKTFIRSEDEKKSDISILGVVTPFNIFSPNEKKVTNSIERINMTLRTYTGGYLRFEEDHYTGDRPWVIATLWMAIYYLKTNDTKSAKECFDFVVNSSTWHGFLAEQVDNSTMKSAWVIGLAWSHAMFIIALEELIKLNMI